MSSSEPVIEEAAPAEMMKKLAGMSWWVVLLRGLAALILGLAALLQPVSTFYLVVYILGIFAIVDGAFVLLAVALSQVGHARRGWLALRGLLGLIVGILIVSHWLGAAFIAQMVLVYLVAFWLVVVGLLEIRLGIHAHTRQPHDWSLIVTGFLLVVLGGVLAIWPAPASVGIIWFFGFFAIIGGVSLIALAVDLRRVSRS